MRPLSSKPICLRRVSASRVASFALLSLVGMAAVSSRSADAQSPAAQSPATQSPAVQVPAGQPSITQPLFRDTLGGGVGMTPVSRGERDRQFAALARDVESMDRLLSLLKRVVKLVTPSVVHIEAQPIREYRVRSGAQEAGSGVIIRFRGPRAGAGNYVLTNRHVIKNSSEPHIRIQLADGRVVTPTQIWSDQYTDVAVMAIDVDNVVPARFGNSDALEIGDWVLAVGSPFGLSQSVTRGIVSAKGRYNLELGDGEVRYQNFLQTDAAINPGNSGGPLINMRGEVVGLNTAIASESGGNEGIGFSIPANIAVRIADELTRTGQVRRGFLGVTFDRLFDEKRARAAGLPRLQGTRITVVEPGSPAERAAVQSGDVIISYGGIRVEDTDHLISLVKLTEIGKQVDLVVFRSGAPVQMTVEIGDREFFATRDN
ncbi:MAG: trypsin-like peptidase domain-containing protein [Planctomycetota bacterium]